MRVVNAQDARLLCVRAYFVVLVFWQAGRQVSTMSGCASRFTLTCRVGGRVKMQGKAFFHFPSTPRPCVWYG